MRLPYQTPRDPDLDHQVIFYIPSGGSSVHVTCNCMAEKVGPTQKESHISFGMVDGDLEVARKLYNDPKNHRKPFNKEDEAKW